VLKKILMIGAIALLFLAFPLMGDAYAQTASAAPSAPEPGSTAFMLISSALVMLMTPGLAFFYGGFVRSRNILNTLMMSFVLMAIVGVTWVLWGYSFAFAPGHSFTTSIIGGFDWLGLNGVGYETTEYAPKIPHQAFMIYQAMFAIITPALISGAIAERMSFTSYSLFVLLWSTFIYSPLAHMVWGKGGLLGLLGGWGALDFAGGTVVHISSGVSALVAAMYLGPRKSFPDRLSPPHNVPFILLGAGLLWFGWFGFNAGSALEANSVATAAFVATNTSAAAGALTWLIMEKVLRGKPTAVGAATGGVAGLVGITPAAGFVTPLASILIGSITAVVCFYAVSFKHKVKVDDALDTYPVHGVGGTVGAILTGIFATTAVNSAGKDGLLGSLFGGKSNPQQLLIQIEAILVAYIVAAVGTWLILKLLDVTVGLRVKEEAENQGLDINEHGEEAYNNEFSDRISSGHK
jgi:ammonium transporter, Amt family